MVHRRHTSRSDASSGQPGLFTRPLTAFGRDGFIGQDIYLGKPTVGQVGAIARNLDLLRDSGGVLSVSNVNSSSIIPESKNIVANHFGQNTVVKLQGEVVKGCEEL